MGRYLDAGLELLDRQVLDCDGRPVGKVDDLELAIDDRGVPTVLVALLVGPQALGMRVGGRVGRTMVGIASRLAGTERPLTIPVEQVAEIGIVVRLDVSMDHLPETGRLEHWLCDQVVARIPGGRRATE